jgi:hypothetical protein
MKHLNTFESHNRPHIPQVEEFSEDPDEFCIKISYWL